MTVVSIGIQNYCSYNLAGFNRQWDVTNIDWQAATCYNITVYGQY